jgi:acetyl-CoA synthetase
MTPLAALEIADPVPADNPGAREIGFEIPPIYNASSILFDNLAKGRGNRLALTGPSGARSYSELCGDASRWGHGFTSLGLKRGDRVLMFLDDTPAYPAAFFGAVRAGFVPLLINTLTPPDLLQFYLSDSGATVAVADAEFGQRFDAIACKGTSLNTLIVVNGAAPAQAVPTTLLAAQWLADFPQHLPQTATHRNEMAFWMYSSGSTGRPKGVVHLQHDMAYSDCAFAKTVLKLQPEDICRRFFSLMASAIPSPSRFRRVPPACCCPASRNPRRFSTRSSAIAQACSSACRRSTPPSPKPRARRAETIRRCAWRFPPPRCFRPKSPTAGSD